MLKRTCPLLTDRVSAKSILVGLFSSVDGDVITKHFNIDRFQSAG